MRPLLLVLSSLFSLALAPSAHAQRGGDFGLGLIIGDPTGLSGKGFVSETNAIDFAVGFSFIHGDHLQLHADYLWHFDIKRWPVRLGGPFNQQDVETAAVHYSEIRASRSTRSCH